MKRVMTLVESLIRLCAVGVVKADPARNFKNHTDGKE